MNPHEGRNDSAGPRRLNIDGRMLGQRMQRPAAPPPRAVPPRQYKPAPQPVLAPKPPVAPQTTIATPQPVYQRPAPAQTPVFRSTAPPNTPVAQPARPIQPLAPVKAQSKPTKTRTNRSSRTNHHVRNVILVVAMLAVFAGGLGLRVYQMTRPILPASIHSSAGYLLFVPVKSADFSIDKASIKYNGTAKVTSYTLKSKSGDDVQVNQQATPAELAKNPSAFDSMVSSLQPIGELKSANGRVVLTSPQQLSGAQVAVMNAQGTLVFIKSSKSLPNDKWTQLLSSFQIEK